MRRMFPDLPGGDGFIQYTVEIFPVRLIMLDTVMPGETHGYLCDARLNWLRQTLRAQPSRETMIAMHHPPLLTGVAQFDDIMLRNSDAFTQIIAANRQVSRIICGHHHRMISGNIAQAICSVAPSIAYQFELPANDMVEVGFMREPAMFLRHDWSPECGFITHAIHAERFPGPFPVMLEPEYPG